MTVSAIASKLSAASCLLHVSEQAAALARLYRRGALCRTIDGTPWRFRWRYIDVPLSGVELRLRIGRAEVAILVEDLGPFGCAVDVARAALPAALRAAYLMGLGAPLWRELEILTECAVQVLDVAPNRIMGLSPDCVGFEVGIDPHGAATRGFLRPIHLGAQEIVLKASRVMAAAMPRPPGLSIRWAAVVGSTTLTTSEVHALEEQGIVVIDDATYAADGLACWLGAGSRRRYAGRVMLRRDGRLQMIGFTSKGRMIMADSEADAVSTEQIGFNDIPLSVRFELVRWDAPLAEVASLAPGAIIDLGRRVDEQSVTVWVEQRCIGKGQLVAVGERLGVRLLSVFDH